MIHFRRYWNRYPGARCDIDSYIYMPWLEETGYIPTEKYACGSELLNHARRIGKRFKLYERTLFQTELRTLHWSSKHCHWSCRTDRGDTITAKYVILAAGPMHRLKLPGIPGLPSFKGASFHSSRWDYGYTGGSPENPSLYQLVDKTVGIVGTGATAIQIIPEVAKWAKKVYVFQRTPSAVGPSGNKKTDEAWVEQLSEGWQMRRMKNFNDVVTGMSNGEDEVNDSWTRIQRRLLKGFPGDAISSTGSKERAEIMARRNLEIMEDFRRHVDDIVKDKETAEKLKPYYAYFCKRPAFHNEYYETFNRPNVELIDTDGKGTEAISETGIVVGHRTINVDCIVYATGFELVTDWTRRAGLELFGENGISLTEKWKDGLETLHGHSTHQFPNCFFVSVQQATLTLNFVHAVKVLAEHLAWIISECREIGVAKIMPTKEAENKWTNMIVQGRHASLKFDQSCVPSHFNNEGNLTLALAKTSRFNGPPQAFWNLLEAWRGKGLLRLLTEGELEGGRSIRRIGPIATSSRV
ncbi:hypothetical protein KEM56_004236 [Ascosphaera pollenicola]|nr:hypothetical protein KEM56_004236 [Ascosphaera pollenicola]